MFEDLLRLNVAVDFDFNMKVPKPLTIPFTLTATQLFSSDEFEYRVSTRMPLASPSENNEQINAADVLRFISDTATWRTVKEDIPIAYENLSKGTLQRIPRSSSLVMQSLFPKDYRMSSWSYPRLK
ncbi:Uncharacterized protein HZ326_4032 [Fusarium oxysporum f. sp. albedinis]|nr:Uncharacterized protein HZ326_4032 [Fusarium oxysporum f. sp. albedinis]